MALTEVSSDTFQSVVLSSSKPVLVDFWAEWCGPCRMLAPILDDVAGKLGEKAKIVKVNVDHNPELASQYGVKGIPSMMLFKDGQLIDSKVGVNQAATLVGWIEQHC